MTNIMTREIFISYSRRDQEFVTRLAYDLNEQVAGVWFDQSTIQAGQKWHAEIMDGIRECKAFILILSPDAVESKYVREEVNKALELGKTIFPILYRPAKWTGEFEALVREIQTLDLRSGSYADNFQKLVDGLLEAGAGKATGERPFLRSHTKVAMSVVLSKIPGWAFAWSLGWLILSLVAFILLLLWSSIQKSQVDNALLNFILFVLSGSIGGFAGGLIAGLFTMLALRPNAPSIAWRHMSPTIRIWGISGPLGLIVSGTATWIMYSMGILRMPEIALNCDDLGVIECVFMSLITAIIGAVLLLIFLVIIFLLFVVFTWFFTGVLAGRQSVKHIRRLEPGITESQSRSVSLGWGCGSLVAAVVTVILFGLLSSVFGLS